MSVDCVDTGDSFALRETEMFIQHAKAFYDISSDAAHSVYTCKKCGSTFNYEWQDFSIHVSRSCLKPAMINVKDIGAEVRIPIPAVAGPYGHSYPEEMFQQVDLDAFKAHLTELK